MGKMSQLESSLLRPFRGTEDNFDEFLKKFKVVARIRKIDSAENRMAYLPLYLAGDAFTVWGEMAEADQKDEDKVVKRLTESFSRSPGEAYTTFV